MLSWVQTWEQTHNRQDRPAFEYQTRLFVWNLLETFFCSQLYGWRLAGLSKIVKITNATVKILDNIIKGDGVCTISATNHIGHMKRPYRPQWIAILATGKMYCYLASTFKSYLFETRNIVCNPVSHKWRVKELNNVSTYFKAMMWVVRVLFALSDRPLLLFLPTVERLTDSFGN